MSELVTRNLSKSYANHRAVRNVSLDIRAGEFFSILGPSGCGKTTLLRLLAGLEKPTGGEIVFRGKSITNQSPQQRRFGLVFQNYALFPHMSVAGNVAFGLEVRKLGKSEIAERVTSVLDSVRLTGRRDYRVSDLSGGEQQRVAVARAVAAEPAVLLFDEPLSNLDVALRVSTRDEIRALQRRTGITTIYVTHDQEEALSLSDRIAVMCAGEVQQVGSPSTIYESPTSPFVAEFLGHAMLLNGQLSRGEIRIDGFPGPFTLPRTMADGPYTVAVKPEYVRCISKEEGGGLTGAVEAVQYQGFTTGVTIRIGELALRSNSLTSEFGRIPVLGEKVGVRIDWDRCTFFPVR